MPKILNVDWNAVRNDYYSGNISCAGLAEKYGIAQATLSGRAWRENWRGVAANRKKLNQKIAERIIEKVADKEGDKVIRWIDESLERAQWYRNEIDKAAEQMKPACDPDALVQLARAEKIADDIGRRALGLDTQAQLQSTRIEIVSPYGNVKRVEEIPEKQVLEIGIAGGEDDVPHGGQKEAENDL